MPIEKCLAKRKWWTNVSARLNAETNLHLGILPDWKSIISSHLGLLGFFHVLIILIQLLSVSLL